LEFQWKNFFQHSKLGSLNLKSATSRSSRARTLARRARAATWRPALPDRAPEDTIIAPARHPSKKPPVEAPCRVWHRASAPGRTPRRADRRHLDWHPAHPLTPLLCLEEELPSTPTASHLYLKGTPSSPHAHTTPLHAIADATVK
jgi:hypothetical protein